MKEKLSKDAILPLNFPNTNKTMNLTQLSVARDASDSRVCKHLFLRGNHQLDMFHDKVDKINVWNRLWLSAAATNTEILSAEILDNHQHSTVLLKSENQDSDFMHYYRLSITQYYNRRYNLKGMLGTRKFGRAIIKSIDDLKDCICYHIRNVLHHGITTNFLDYQFSTGRFVFNLEGEKQKGVYTRGTLPPDLAKQYLPAREQLPEGWMMTREGMIVPPDSVFRRDIVESLFGSREEYLDALSHQTQREILAQDEPCADASDSRVVQSLDEQVTEFVNKIATTPIPSMSQGHKMEVIASVKEEFPKISFRTLERIFAIPASTIRFRLKVLRRRE